MFGGERGTPGAEAGRWSQWTIDFEVGGGGVAKNGTSGETPMRGRLSFVEGLSMRSRFSFVSGLRRCSIKPSDRYSEAQKS